MAISVKTLLQTPLTGYTGSIGPAGAGYTGSQGISGYTGSIGVGYTGSSAPGYTGSSGSTTGSGLFNTRIDGASPYVVTSTMANALVMSSNAIVHSIFITNIDSTGVSNVSVSGNIRYGGLSPSAGTNTYFSRFIPVPYRTSVELLKKPKILNNGDAIQLQSFNAWAGTNGLLHATIVYETVTSSDYIGVGRYVTTDTITDVYQSTNFPSVVESIMITNTNTIGNIAVTLSWTYSNNALKSYLTYEFLIPIASTVEICEAPKRLDTNDKIRVITSAGNTVAIYVAARKLT